MSDVLVKHWNPQYELIHLVGLTALSMLMVQKYKESTTIEPYCAGYFVLQSIPLHTKLSCLAHLLKVTEAVLQAELHRSVPWHKQQRLLLEWSRRGFQREQQSMKH